ncbi:TraB/GumN family protein [Caulobacter sp. UC70_42]|uniref:TraB/GumN family protein n=1 Tax=Caulobacter sp. UC70_42 TaxID=3374551 RepID=UPI003756BF98
MKEPSAPLAKLAFPTSVDAQLPDIQRTRRQFLGYGLPAACVALAPRSVLAAPKAPLWTVEKGGKRIYVLGETLPRPVDWRAPEIVTLLERCGRLWTETNQIYRRPGGELIKQFGMSTSPSPLELLSPEQLARLKTAMALTAVSMNDLAGARPWLIGATIEDAGYRAAGLTGKSANAVLSARATEIGVPVSSEFEVKDDVFAWFAGMTPKQEAQFLCYAVDGALLGREGSERISTEWLAGRQTAAADFVDHERRDYPELYAKLTVERNRAWVPRFETMLNAPKPTLVVVGLYHLVGPESMLVQLRRAGFEVI